MDLNIDISKDGYRILKVEQEGKKVYFGSRYNHKKEIERFINSFGEITVKDNFIILGLSFGEHIEELLKIIDSNTKILILEFNSDLMNYCKKDEQINRIISNENVIVSNNINDIELFIKKYINEFNVDRLNFKAYSNYGNIYANQLNTVCSLINSLIAEIIIKRNTYKHFAEIFSKNMISNFRYIAKETEINVLKNVYKNKPAVIVSAGPSLIKNIDILCGTDNALVLTGGRTLEALLKRNIRPTCLGVVDPGEISYKLVETHIGDLDIPLVFNDLTNYRVVNNHKAGKFFYTDSELIWDICGKKIETMYGGGSIALSLTNLAIYMGCNPIIFIGQDLAYTNEQEHSTDCDNSSKKLDGDKFRNKNDIYVKDIYGSDIRTSVTLNTYRINLERIIKANPKIRFINCSEGGAFIKGAENKKLKDVTSRFKTNKIAPMEGFLSNTDRMQSMIEKLNLILKIVYEDIDLCKKAQTLLFECKNSKSDSILKQLNKIDSELENHSKEGLLYIIIMKLKFNIENDEKYLIKICDNENTRMDKQIEKKRFLYSEMEKVMSKHVCEIQKLLNELKDI